MKNGTVLVTDGYWRKSLACVRALAGAGLRVGVGERTRLAAALFSRHATWRFVYPSVQYFPTQFIRWLDDTLARREFDALIVPEEETSLLLAQHPDVLAGRAGIVQPSAEQICLARDKYRLIAHAISLGIACPQTRLATSPADLDAATRNFAGKTVIKPVVGTGALGVRYAESPGQLGSIAARSLREYGGLLIQEYVPGAEYYGVSLLFNTDSELRAAFVHKKLRQYPVAGGVSTYAVSVYRPDLVDIAAELLRSLRWRGVANVEFKVDERDGVPRLMEVNPRLWGSVHLAVMSGVNFPYLLYRMAVENDIEPRMEYRTGVRFRWLVQGDLMNFLSNLRQGRVVWSFFRFLEKDTHYALMSARDPLPVLGRILSVADFLTSREMKRFRKRK